jgi:N-succinyldiaminopimelate aminotransferase
MTTNPVALPADAVLATRLRGLGTSIFAEMTRLAVAHGAVNLGQGFPDFDPPELVLAAAREAMAGGRHQYARMFGLPELVAAVAAHAERFRGLLVDGEREVTVTSGATEAITDTLLALLEPGDEVVLFAPWYDSYRAAVALAGGRAVEVPLLPPEFAFDPARLAAAIGPRTRVLVVNTPQNPIGKVWCEDELRALAALACHHDLWVLADEVYEHLVYDGAHCSLATLPGMRERTITVGSAGKIFSCTGWKVGWAIAPPPLTAALRTVHQFVTFATATPLQAAVAVGLRAPDGLFSGLASDLAGRRDRWCEGLAGLGINVRRPAGTYFAMVDAAELGASDADELCRRLPAEAGVAAVPVTAFASEPEPYRRLLRFAFCKREATLDEALRRLKVWRSGRARPE